MQERITGGDGEVEVFNNESDLNVCAKPEDHAYELNGAHVDCEAA